MSMESQSEYQGIEPPGYKFPPWIEQLIPIDKVKFHIGKWGLNNEFDDICSEYSLKLEKLKKNGSEITGAYAFTILKNLCNDQHRKNNREQQLIKKLQKNNPETVANPASNQIEQKEEKEKKIKLVELAIDQLGLELRERVILRLKTYQPQKFTFKEIAKIVGYSESTARVEYNKCYDRISNCVKKGLNENNQKSFQD